MNQDQLCAAAQKLLERADWKVGGVLSPTSRRSDFQSSGISTVKTRDLAGLRDALTATQQAAPSQGEVDRAYGYAKRLAESIWERHYKDVSPNWKAMGTLIGILTQIDNMTAGLLEASAQREQPASCCSHASDCAVHNEPAFPAGPCDCGAEKPADSKPEPRAQAREPEVALWRYTQQHFDSMGGTSYEYSRNRLETKTRSDWVPYITLQSHREAMAQANGQALMLAGELQRLRAAIKDKGGDEHSPTQWAYDQACRVIRERDEAIAKKDAALKACVDALEACTTEEGPDQDELNRARAAITQGQEAMK